MQQRDGATMVALQVNGELREELAEPRMLLSDFLRHKLACTGTHVGCEQGVCGACTVLVDGKPVRSCLTFAVQVDGAKLETVEGMADGGKLDPIQEAFRLEHGLQCGFCTPGFLMSTKALLDENPNPTEAEIRDELSGNICRCTGYQSIVAAVKTAVTLREEASRDA